MTPVNYSEMLNQTVNFKGRTLIFRDFVERFKLHNDDLDNPNGIVLTPETCYYMRQLNRHKDLKFFMSFNFSFIFFNSILTSMSWLAYRRMYKYAFCYVLVFWGMVALAEGADHLLSTQYTKCGFIILSITVVWIILSFCFLPLVGNCLYLRKLAQDIIKEKPIKTNNANCLYYLLFYIFIPPKLTLFLYMPLIVIKNLNLL